MKFGSLRRMTTLTAKSIGFIVRNGPQPDGRLMLCRMFVPIPEQNFDLYRRLVQMETDFLEMPREPLMIVNFIEVADADYRECQVSLRVSYKGEERWYLNHILINNFFGWIYGLKDYGYNKYLYPVDYRFNVDDPSLYVELPGGTPHLRASFRRDDSLPELEVEDPGSYSIKGNRLLFCKSEVSDSEEISTTQGYMDIHENRFHERRDQIDYPTEWSLLIPAGSYRAGLYFGFAKDVRMGELVELERW